MSRQYTQEECRRMFLEHVAAIAEHWIVGDTPQDIVESQGLTTEVRRRRWAVEGVVHSLLCLFDGASGFMPAFDIYPAPHPEDEAYHKEEDSNWWPSGTDVSINGDDSLHDLWSALHRARLDQEAP